MLSSEIASSPHRIGVGKNLLAKKVNENYTYIGHFLNGNMDERFEGDGLLINKKPHEYIYDGNWKNGSMHGFGKLKMGITKKGQYYEGHFKDSQKDGLVSSKV